MVVMFTSVSKEANMFKWQNNRHFQKHFMCLLPKAELKADVLREKVKTVVRW